MKLSKEINLLIVGGMAILGILFAAINVYTINKNSKAEMNHLSSLLKSERESKLRDLVYSAYSVLDTANFYEPAQAALSEMRFGKKRQNYFLVVDTDGMVWVNPVRPESVGKVKLDMEDAAGKPYIREIIDKAMLQSEGFVNYRETPEGAEKPVTRMTYYKHFKEWDWIVCAGMYMDDINRLLSAKQDEIKQSMLFRVILITALVILTVIMGITVATYVISKRIINPLVHISDAAGRIGMGDFSNDINVNASTEINQLAGSVMMMQKNLEIAIRRAKNRSSSYKNTSGASDRIRENELQN
ncbi:MAG: cache domain-containing protein [Desulfarculaceae bacterium]|nr:cache domain-containing protein [Desulfarculaceae bacterium]